MSTCPSRDDLQALLDGQVAAGDLLFAHLVQCPICRAQAEDLSSVDTVRQMQRRAAEMPDEGDVPMLGELRSKLYALPRAMPAAHELCPDLPSPSRRLGRYHLHEVLGAGGFGIVYRADDEQLNRSVALKIPQRGMLDDADARRRYVQEARVAASLHHPHIVALYDAGEIGGTWFLASAFIPGPTLARWLKEHVAVAPRQAARILAALASAVQHAHEQGVLHRDIKPQNVLLDPTVNYGELGFSPKLTDFGVAKLLGLDIEHTVTGQLVGTPRYMAPELATGRRDATTPTCDIFSLGVVLYELLTGTTPFQGASNIEVLRSVTEDEPTFPRRLRPDVPRDLEAICLRCLEKTPRHRYQSAGELAADLERYLKQLPTVARPVTVAERAVRWTRRRPALASLMGVSLLATVLLVTGLAVHSRRLAQLNEELSHTNLALERAASEAQSAESRAQRSEADTDQLLYIADLRLAGKAWRDGDLRSLRELLDQHEPRAGAVDRRGLEWHFLARRARVVPETIASAPAAVYQLRIDRQRRRLAAVGKDAVVRLYDTESGALKLSLPTGQVEINGVDFSSDGGRLATAGDDGTLRVWNLDDQAPITTIQAHTDAAYQVRFADNDGTLVSCGRDRAVHAWDATRGDPRGSYAGNKRHVEALEIAGDWLASAGQDGAVRVWNRAENRLVHEWDAESSRKPVLCVCVSPDRKLLAAGGANRQVSLWSLVSGKLLGTGGHLNHVNSVTFSPDSRKLASGDADGAICLWELRTILDSSALNGDPPPIPLVRKWHAHEGVVHALLWDEAPQLVSSGADGQILRWDESVLTTKLESDAYLAGLIDVVFTPSSQVLVRHQSHLLALDLPFDRDRDDRRLPAEFSRMAADRSGRTILTLASDGTVESWDTAASENPGGRLGKRLSVWQLESTIALREIGLSPNGRSVAVLYATSPPRIHVHASADGDLQRQLTLPDGSISQLSFSPSGALLAAAVNDDVFVWSLAGNPVTETLGASNASVLRIAKAQSSIQSLAFSPDETLLATGGMDRTIRFWDPRTGAALSTLHGHRAGVRGLVFSHDGRTLVSAADDGAIKAWNVASRAELFDLVQGDPQQSGAIHLSPNGNTLAARRNSDNRLMLLELR